MAAPADAEAGSCRTPVSLTLPTALHFAKFLNLELTAIWSRVFQTSA
jgi:hypothetical protein